MSARGGRASACPGDVNPRSEWPQWPCFGAVFFSCGSVPVLVQRDQVLSQVPPIHQTTFLRGHRPQPHPCPLSPPRYPLHQLWFQCQFRLWHMHVHYASLKRRSPESSLLNDLVLFASSTGHGMVAQTVVWTHRHFSCELCGMRGLLVCHRLTSIVIGTPS